MKDRIGEWREEWLLEEWAATIPREYRAHGIYPGTWPEGIRVNRHPNPWEGAILLPWDGGTAYPRQRLRDAA